MKNIFYAKVSIAFLMLSFFLVLEARTDLGKSAIDKEVVEKVSCHFGSIFFGIFTYIATLSQLIATNTPYSGKGFFTNHFSTEQVEKKIHFT